MENKKIVMSLGGSLIIPNGVDVDFVKGFVSLIKEYNGKDGNLVFAKRCWGYGRTFYEWRLRKARHLKLKYGKCK